MKCCHTYIIGVIVCTAALAGCASTNAKGDVQPKMPPNAESEYLKTVAVGILLNANVEPAEIKYAITLKARKPLPESAIAVLEFENPDPRAAAVKALYEPKADQKEMFVVSPSVACIVNQRHYRVVVTLFGDHKRRDILGTHEQMVAFFIDPMLLRTVRVRECRPTEQGSRGESGNLSQANEINGVTASWSPIWSIDFPEDEAWEVAYTDRKGGSQIIEYTAGGEKVESWSQLVTFAYSPLPKERFQDAVTSWLSRIETGCSSSRSQILAKSEYMVAFRWAGEGCGGFPPQEEVVRVEYVHAGLVWLKYTYYKERAKPDFEGWVRRVIEAKVK